MAVTPLNYRLSSDGLRELIDRLPTPLVIADAEYLDVVAGAGKQVISSDEFIESPAPPSRWPSSPTPTTLRSCCSPPAPPRARKPSS